MFSLSLKNKHLTCVIFSRSVEEIGNMLHCVVDLIWYYQTIHDYWAKTLWQTIFRKANIRFVMCNRNTDHSWLWVSVTNGRKASTTVFHNHVVAKWNTHRNRTCGNKCTLLYHRAGLLEFVVKMSVYYSLCFVQIVLKILFLIPTHIIFFISSIPLV